MATKKDPSSTNLVLGRVTDAQNRVLPNLLVRVYDRDMRSEELLSETTTDREGKYEIIWYHHQLEGRGTGREDIGTHWSTYIASW